MDRNVHLIDNILTHGNHVVEIQHTDQFASGIKYLGKVLVVFHRLMLFFGRTEWNTVLFFTAYHNNANEWTYTLLNLWGDRGDVIILMRKVPNIFHVDRV